MGGRLALQWLPAECVPVPLKVAVESTLFTVDLLAPES
jgi:hypothetical protein